MTRLERDCARALQTSASRYSLSLSAELTKRRAWASSLFAGFRLTYAVAGNDDLRLDDWLAALPEIDLPLAHHFVVDAEVVERGAGTATIELLALEG